MPRVTRATSAASSTLSSAPSETSPNHSFQPLPDEVSTPRVQWSVEQRDALFAIAREKADQELQAVTAKIRREEEESQARIAALRTPATAAAQATSTRIEREEDTIGEISPAILSVAGRYPGLPKAEMARIYENRFKPENLYKFRHLKGREDKDRDENITFENGQIKIKKVTGTLRDFGNTIDIWSDGFLNYSMVLVDFFGVAFPSLFRSLLLFHSKIRHLSRIYDWQQAVLPLAIDYHTEITTGTHTDVDAWTLPQHWVDQYCSPLWVIQKLTPGSRKRTASTAFDNTSSGKKNSGEICRNFNTKGCSYKECPREHRCSECNSKDHGALNCKNPKP